MFKKFYMEMIVPITQLTNAQLHDLITYIVSFIVITTIVFMIVFFSVKGLKNIVKVMFVSLFVSVYIVFNFFWVLCFFNDGWKEYFLLAPVIIYMLLHTVRLCKNNKERKNKDDNI